MVPPAHTHMAESPLRKGPALHNYKPVRQIIFDRCLSLLMPIDGEGIGMNLLVSRLSNGEILGQDWGGTLIPSDQARC